MEMALGLTAIFGVPLAVLALMYWMLVRSRRVRREIKTAQLPVSAPAMEEIVGADGGLTMMKRSEYDEALADVELTSQRVKHIGTIK